MSRLAVRTAIKDFLDANSSEDVIDITAEFEELKDLLQDHDIQPEAPWLGLEFSADPAEPVSLTANNTQGLYREYGLISLHVVTSARLGAGNELLSRGEGLINLFEGSRIGDVVINTVGSLNTGPGATLEFEGGYVSGTITLGYHFDYSRTE